MHTERASHRETLHALLRTYNSDPDQRLAVVQEIERQFQRPLAILVIDTCGFSRSVRSSGIVAFLALLQRLTDIVRPDVERCSGSILRTEADNVFVTFPDPESALRCAQAILNDVARENAIHADGEHIYVSMGIGYGDLLVIEGETVYGDEMNLASKLGEDLADESEVLLTPAAHAALDPTSWLFEPATFSISGLSLTAYRFIHASVMSTQSA
jgi:adenylate cyclase